MMMWPTYQVTLMGNQGHWAGVMLICYYPQGRAPAAQRCLSGKWRADRARRAD